MLCTVPGTLLNPYPGPGKDPDPAFRFNTDPDSALAPDANLRPLIYTLKSNLSVPYTALHSSILSLLSS
jgi:hypothetical protein